eukprot:Awhi_evm1s9170
MSQTASRTVLVDAETGTKKKSLGKISQFKKKRKTIAFVSAFVITFLMLVISITVGVTVGLLVGLKDITSDSETTEKTKISQDIGQLSSSGSSDPSKFAYSFDSAFRRNAHVVFSRYISPYDILEGDPFGNRVEESDKHDTKHLTTVYDSELKKDVLQIVMHRDRDGDGASSSKSDRQRTEFKASQKSDRDILGYEDDELIYAWWFKVDENASPSNKFWHIFQLKWYGHRDGTPMTTFGLKTFNGSPKFYYTDFGDQTILGDMDNFVGKWVQAFVQVKFSDNKKGSLFMDFKDIYGNRLIEKPVVKTKIDRFGSGDFIRPKFGIYRSLEGKGDLQNEDYIWFSDISIYKKE